VASGQQSTLKDKKQGSLNIDNDDTQHWPQHQNNHNRNAQDIGCDQSCGIGRVEQQSRERSTISLGRGSGRPLQHKPERESFVPAQWKQSNIIPIPKVTNPTKPSECRPVCLTSCPRKAIEKIIAKDILRRTKAIWQKSDQFGFLPIGQEHHGRNRQNHRRLGACTGQQGDDSRRLFQLQQSVRPGEPQEADAETQETATTIPNIMDSRMAE
jgi:hypothetical protein